MTQSISIQRDRIVEIHYDLRDAADNLLETTREGPAKLLLYGHGNLLAGLERALLGKSAGDNFDLQLPPAEAFGERQADLTQRVSKKHFRSPKRLRPGMQTMLQSRQGPRLVTVLKVGSSVVDVDLNHPRAGHTLNCSIDVISVRAATKEELAHGHAHGPGGHAH
jgi:FKBP-type peptidyl-prolyl cis-trans isomerase SlyD